MSTHISSYSEVYAPTGFINRIIMFLQGFFIKKETKISGKIYHGNYCYDLIPNTAIRIFNNISSVTFIEAGECYVYFFEKPRYQGHYQILRPGENIQVANCGSVIVSTDTFSIDTVRSQARPPEWCWELSGSMYIWHFSPGYKFV